MIPSMLLCILIFSVQIRFELLDVFGYFKVLGSKKVITRVMFTCL
mgnify:CR=1 FL=1